MASIEGAFHRLSEESKNFLKKPFLKEKVWETIYGCDGNKAPSLNKYNLEFFKGQWQVVKVHVFLHCVDVYVSIEWHYWVIMVTVRVQCGNAHDGDSGVLLVCCVSAHTDDICHVRDSGVLEKLSGAGCLTSPEFRCSENAFSLQRETLRWLGNGASLQLWIEFWVDRLSLRKIVPMMYALTINKEGSPYVLSGVPVVPLFLLCFY
ncbi:Uncharacterized protein TCM_019134 [Theobroma cacao]|uniref:Uncharacterized protein n=1 Tax=Theobroma cacao TaxID=3641 RepID=A0A061EGY5_THECC|nr:Uncharacterized protein TCM_019134 [Theobroma cacao]